MSACIAIPLGTLAADYKFPAQTLTVPDGFEVEQIAGPSMVNRPIEADFDEQGRLYVTDSSGSNAKVDKQLAEKPHRIVRLEGVDSEGRFQKSTVFADKMMFPEGAMWLDGSLYVGAPPSIWKLTDTNDDGIADERSEWIQAKTLTGCANDLHGPYAGPDGWIYWCKGAFAQQTWERPGKEPLVTRAAHIFRCRPDGTGVEPVMTGGMDNPVEVIFTPTGERIFTTTFLQNPGGGKRDGLIHAVYGGVYGKVNDVTDNHPHTGDLMPVMTHLGPAAPCGLVRYESTIFGSSYQDNLFSCSFNLHKVIRHVLTPVGATFKTVETDFVTSDNPDFHPTDVIEDADGSLIVLDTGGWYKICCPTSQLAKPDVLGGIYRIRRKGAPHINDPRGLKMDWNKLSADAAAALLDDPRPAVQKRAISRIAKLGEKSLPALRQILESGRSARASRNAIWALTRIDSETAGQITAMALINSDATVRHVAVHSLSLWRNAAAVPSLINLLSDEDAQVRRSAAEALGRTGDKKAVPQLLAAAAKTGSDRFAEHSIIFALIEIGDHAGTRAGLNADPLTRRAALIALDQMTPAGQLHPEEVIPLLTSSDGHLKETAGWILRHHKDWGKSVSGYFETRLSENQLPENDRKELFNELVPFTETGEIQNLLTSHARAGLPTSIRTMAIEAMGRASLSETPSAWWAAIADALTSSETNLVGMALNTAKLLPVPKAGRPAEVSDAIAKVGMNTALPVDQRLEALSLAKSGTEIDNATFALLKTNLEPEKPVIFRSAAATALSRAKLSDGQLESLTEILRTAGPFEVIKLLGAFQAASDEALGMKLIDALGKSKSATMLRADVLKPKITKFPSSVQQKADALLASINTDSSAQRQHLDELLPRLMGGDVRRGQLVFNNPKAACSSCHAIGYLGGHVGPDLTSIGTIRTERDILESIIYPSASFVRSFEPVIVTTKSGDAISGILKKDSPEELVLTTGPDNETRVARNDFLEMRPGAVSIMPQGLDQQLSRQELSDLLAFLKNTRWGAQ